MLYARRQIIAMELENVYIEIKASKRSVSSEISAILTDNGSNIVAAFNVTPHNKVVQAKCPIGKLKPDYQKKKMKLFN